jgi:hypothetical protein
MALGARAYTIGRDVHLGAEANSLSSSERERLLRHEAVHTVQQGAASVDPIEGMSVSHPGDRAELEASRLAAGMNRYGPAINRLATPLIQRDIPAGPHRVKDGTFHVSLKDESNPGGKSGVKGTIKFTADPKAPDSTSIRLLQTVRDEDLTTGKEYVWTGGEADRMKAMTAKDKKAGVEPGRFVDAQYSSITPRSKKADAAVSPYYRDYWPNATMSQDGSKKGTSVAEASLWDFPGSFSKRRFSFETAAKAADHGYIYATFRWGFTISDGAKGTIDHERGSAQRGPSATFLAAVKQFNEYTKNPGSSTAP